MNGSFWNENALWLMDTEVNLLKPAFGPFLNSIGPLLNSDGFKLISMNYLGIGLLVLLITGVWLWLGPKKIKKLKPTIW